MINTNNDINNLDNTINTISSRNSFRPKDDKFKYYKQYLYPGLNFGTVYIISIIDYLQSFNFYKLVEYECKTVFNKGEKTDIQGGISCVNPKLYSERFINYVNNLTKTKYILTGKKKN